jgi:tetratricopeptide (TPR) repeat protein
MATVLVWVLLPSVGFPADELSRTERLRQAMQTLSVAETALVEERFEVAEQFFLKALTLLAEDSNAPLPTARAYNGRARIYQHQESWTEAAEAYGKAAEFFSRAFPDPREPEALARYQRAHALWSAGSGMEADKELTRAIEIWQSRATPTDKGLTEAIRLREKLRSESNDR